MTSFWNAFYILIFTLIISLISYYIFGVRGPWESFWIKSFLLFLFLLAVSLWVKPVGPQWYGVQWTVLFISALLFILLLAAFSSSRHDPKIPTKLTPLEKRRLAEEYSSERWVILYSVGMMFWLLLILLVVIIAVGYYLS